MEGKNGGVIFGEYKKSDEKTIISIVWMDDKMKSNINTGCYGDKFSLKVLTQNFDEGEKIDIIIGEKNNQDLQEIQLTGYVDSNGYALLREVVHVDKQITKLI